MCFPAHRSEINFIERDPCVRLEAQLIAAPAVLRLSGRYTLAFRNKLSPYSHIPTTKVRDFFKRRLVMRRLLITSIALVFSALSLANSQTAQLASDVITMLAPNGIDRVLSGPNLTFYKPVGWSDVIVISNVSGTFTDASAISTDQPVYVDLAWLNNGTTTASSFYIRLYVDGVQKYQALATLPAGYYQYKSDANIGTLGPGVHTLTLVIDATNAVSELSENDNSYTRTFAITAGKGFITTQVLYHGTSLLSGAVVQILDENGYYLSDMVFQPSGDPYPGYWRGIIPDISRNYILKCLLNSDSIYSRTQWNLGDPEPTYIQGNTYTVYSSDFRPSWTFNGISRGAYPRQFCWGKIPDPPVGSLNITLYQELDWGLTGPSGRVELYNAAGGLVAQKRANTISIVQFDGLPAGTYSYKVYNNRSTIWGEQYWGHKTVAVTGGGIAYDAHKHNTPFMPAMRVYNNTTGALLPNGSRTDITAGTHLRVEVDVTNPNYPGSEDNTAIVTEIKLDRDTQPPYDRAYSSNPYVLNKGQSVTTLVYLMGPSLITENGAYSISCACYVSGGLYGSTTLLTDAGGWIDPAFNIILGSSGLPDTTVLLTPLNGTIVSQPITFSWRKIDGASKYWLSYSLDNWLTANGDSTLVDTFKVVTGLPGGSTVRWNVATGNASGWNTASWKHSNWVTTSLLSPQLESPTNGALNVPLSVLLEWHSVLGATRYRIQVAANSGFVGTLVYDDTTNSDTSKIIPSLNENMTYYWHVRAETPSLQSEYSPTWHFQTVLGAPSLLRPADQATNQAIVVTLVWRSLMGSASYHLQVGASSGIDTSAVLNDSTLTDTARTVGAFKYNTQYFWRVRGKNAGAYSPWSQLWSFRTMESDPAVPKLMAPASMVAGLDTPVTLRWTRPVGATSFHLQVGGDSTFTSGIIHQDYPTADTFAVLHSLSFLTSYWWHVNAYNPSTGVSAYSPAWKFSTGLSLPGVVVLVDPPQNAVVNADTLRLRWSSTGPFVDKYWMEYSIDSAFIVKATDSLLTDTTTVLRSMAKNIEYYWRVRAHNLTGWGPYSSRGHFVRSALSVDDLAHGMPGDWVLKQNYPNPFNPSTTIMFGLPVRARVRLVVYNPLGEEVAELTNADLEAGYHTVTFDASGLSSGVYLYRMQAGSYLETKKLLLVR